VNIDNRSSAKDQLRPGLGNANAVDCGFERLDAARRPDGQGAH
jgi:hypothetical protein